MLHSITKLASLVALILVTIPSVLCFFGVISIDQVKLLALIGTIVWFSATPLWMGRETPVDANQAKI